VKKAVILVVEDEVIIRISAVQMLEDAGFAVLDAPNADVAIQILEMRALPRNLRTNC
jgi:two-component system, response regulator PdtaR